MVATWQGGPRSSGTWRSCRFSTITRLTSKPSAGRLAHAIRLVPRARGVGGCVNHPTAIRARGDLSDSQYRRGPGGNFRRVEYALETARGAGAAIAAFPESVILGWENPDAHRLATPIPGADSDRLAALAKKYGLMISIGLDEKDGHRLYDSAILVDKTGRLLWKHRKLIVLPELMDPPYAQGTLDGIGGVDTEFGRIGMLICADTFGDANVERIRAFDPDLVLIPYGWAAEVDKWPGHSKSLEDLVVRRARQWKAPVVAANLVGLMTHGPWKGQTFGGASLAVDGSGQIIATLRDRDVDVRVVDVPLRTGARRSN